MMPSSVPTRKEVGSSAGKAMQVGERSSGLEGAGGAKLRCSWGWVSMSTVQVQRVPSVEQEMILWAFWEPVIERE